MNKVKSKNILKFFHITTYENPELIDAKTLFAKHAPMMNSIAKKAIRHPAVAEYMAEDGCKPFFGINTIW